MSTEFTPEQEKLVQERVNDEVHKALYWAFKLMKEHYGDEVYQVLKKSHAERIYSRFSKLAEENGDTSIEAFARHIWEELPAMGFEYTQEQTDLGIQMKCTKCPPAEIAKRLGITEMMFYMCCEQDQFMPDGFNPSIGFKRTKTLMQGDDCCDHFYYYKDKSKQS